jgi:hypothetical protein
VSSLHALVKPPIWIGRGRTFPRLLLPFAVVLVAIVLVTGIRTGAYLYQNNQAQRAVAAAKQAVLMPMPSSPQIEQEWGIRVSLVQLLASGGLVEVRYEVLNTDRANRLHADSSIDTIPSILLEGTDQQIMPRSLMFHFHHGDKGTEGRTYSIVYGNSGGILHRGSLVTIRMKDGLTLQHVPVEG